MSAWGTITAEFRHPIGAGRSTDRGPSVDTLNVGSESPPDVHFFGEESIAGRDDAGAPDPHWHVHGRLRDVTDQDDSPAVLAWFVRESRWFRESRLTWDLDRGPKYRWVTDGFGIRKLRGVLDQ